MRLTKQDIAIIEAGKEEAKNQFIQTAAVAAQSTAPQISLLSSMPWWSIILLVLFSLYVAYWFVIAIRWLFKWAIIAGVGTILLFTALKIWGH